MTLLRFPHPNLVSLLDYFGTQDGGKECLCMVMPLCDTSLQRAVASSKFVNEGLAPPAVAAHARGSEGLAPSKCVKQLVVAAAHLHGLGVVHGDISLGNCLVDRCGTLRLGDYGSAHSAHGCAVKEERTTAYCRAPERWMGLKDLAPPADVWAVGVIAWCLVSNRPPARLLFPPLHHARARLPIRERVCLCHVCRPGRARRSSRSGCPRWRPWSAQSTRSRGQGSGSCRCGQQSRQFSGQRW